MHYFFNNKQKNQIATYVENIIWTSLQPKYKKFIPVVEMKIENLCKQWLKTLKMEAQNFPENFHADIDYVYLDEKGAKLVQQIFCEKFQLEHVDTAFEYYCQNSLLQETNEKGRLCSFRFAWCPDNIFIYPASILPTPLKYVCSPEEKLNGLWQDAQQGINTDIVFHCKEKMLYAHRAVLQSKADYFKALISWQSGDLDSIVVKLKEVNAEVLEAFLYYCYLGSLEKKEGLDPIQLLKVFELAQMYLQEDLKNHAVELLQRAGSISEPLLLDKIAQMAHKYESTTNRVCNRANCR